MADTTDVKQKALAMYQKRVREHKLLESKVKASTSIICKFACKRVIPLQLGCRQISRSQ